MNIDVIERSLEIAGGRGEDLTFRVYLRLFAAHPEMEALFIRDTNGSVRGEMLARVFELILDFIDRRAYATRMIQCEVITHEGYGVPPDVFGIFFSTVADALKESLGADWTADMDTAWRDLVGKMVWFSTHPDQAIEAGIG